jgi:hypothetical protein
MRSRWFHVAARTLAPLATLAALAAVLACSHETTVNVPCSELSCACMGPECGDHAVLDCGDAMMCTPTCMDFGKSCDATCAGSCMFECMSGPGCTLTCGDQCNVSCEGTTTCAVTCGAGCTYACTNVNDCGPTVGPESVVTCTSSSNCDVKCTGTCRVHCIGSEPCVTTCVGGGSPSVCVDGFACGEAC